MDKEKKILALIKGLSENAVEIQSLRRTIANIYLTIELQNICAKNQLLENADINFENIDLRSSMFIEQQDQQQ